LFQAGFHKFAGPLQGKSEAVSDEAMSRDDPAMQPVPSATTASLPAGRLTLLFMVMLVTAAGNTAMQSVMPSIGTALGVEDVWISLAYTWSALLWMLCAPVWARRSDRRGRKAMMAIGLLGFIASFGLCGLMLWLGLNGWLSATATLLLFALCRSLYGGFGSAAPPAVQAYVASRTNRAERTKSLSLLASSFGLGTVIGPALAPFFILPGLGLMGPFAVFTAIAIVVLITLRLRLPDDSPAYAARGDVIAAPFSANSDSRSRQRDEEADEIDPATIPRLSWRDARLRPWLLSGLIGGHAQAMMFGIIGFLVLDRLGMRDTPMAGAGPTGIVLMASAIATLLAQWGLIPLLHLGPRASSLWGMVLAVLGVALLAVSYELHSITMGMALAAVGFGLFRPGFTAGSSLAVSRAEQGQAAGIVASVNGAAYIVAPAAGVWLYGHSQWVGFAVIELLCITVFVLGLKNMTSDEELLRPNQR
jgi:MFS family permease